MLCLYRVYLSGQCIKWSLPHDHYQILGFLTVDVLADNLPECDDQTDIDLK